MDMQPCRVCDTHVVHASEGSTTVFYVHYDSPDDEIGRLLFGSEPGDVLPRPTSRVFRHVSQLLAGMSSDPGAIPNRDIEPVSTQHNHSGLKTHS
jgi:hypothetical protein